MIGLLNPDQRSVAKTSGFPHPYIYTYTARALPLERILALKGEGITWMGQPSRQGIALFSVRTEFWRSAGVAERWVGSCRRDLLDHIIAVDERHLKRLLAEYIRYYHEDRTHLGLGKGTPDDRTRTIVSGRVLSHMRLGGLHHRYDRAA